MQNSLLNEFVLHCILKLVGNKEYCKGQMSSQRKTRKRGKTRMTTTRLVSVLHLRVVRVSGPVTHRAMQSKAKQSGGHFRHSIENCSSLTCFTFGSLYILSCRLIEAVRGVLQKILLASRTTRSMSTPKMQEIR